KPQGVPKTFGPSGVSGSANFPVRNGQTTGTAVAGPLGPGSFTCPPGQLRFLDAVSYSNTFVTDQFVNTLHATPDPISATVHIQVYQALTPEPLIQQRAGAPAEGAPARHIARAP